MNKILLKLLSVLIFTAGVTCASPSFAAGSNDVWFNDLKTTFLNNKAIILAINIRSFNAQDKNGDDIIQPSKGDVAGNFVNAVNRLDEIKSYGINTIHICRLLRQARLRLLAAPVLCMQFQTLQSLILCLMTNQIRFQLKKRQKTL